MTNDDVTVLLREFGEGREDASARLIEAVYYELRWIAEDKMRRERDDHALQPTALAHEAYLRLVGATDRLQSRSHFFGAAAKAMERILIDHARARGAVKRGGDSKRVSLRDVSDVPALPDLDVIALADATSHLESLSPKNAELVRLRHALGLTNDEVASVLGVSVATLKRRWAFVRAWLHDRMNGVE